MESNKIIYFGTPEFAVEPLKVLLDSGYNVCAVVTAPDKPAGRGLQSSQSDVKKFALERGLTVLQPHLLKDKQFLTLLKEYNAHIFVVVAFRMLPKEVWSIPKLGTFNLHASLLPMYRGAAPINHAIINGEKLTGVTTFMIDDKIDTGKIIFQEECEITESDCAGTLHDKLMHQGSLLVVQTVKALITGKVQLYPQSRYLSGWGELKEAPKLTKESCRIDWNRNSKELFNLIRGLSPYPASHSIMYSEDRVIPVKIFSAVCEDNNYMAGVINSCKNPGDIESDNRTFMKVKCGTGNLSITSVQAAGKKRLGIKEFLAGIRDIESYRFK